MSEELSDYLPRRPVQARSKAKVQHILKVANELLRDGRIDNFSLPRVAQAAAVPKPTVYQFFPSKYALFNALGEIHLQELEGLILLGFDASKLPHWEEAVRSLIHSVADYYVDEHGARALLLGGSITPQLYEAQENTLQKIANIIRRLLHEAYALPELPQQPDIYLLTCEIVRTVFAVGEYTRHAMTPDITEEACRAAIGYLRQHLGS